MATVEDRIKDPSSSFSFKRTGTGRPGTPPPAEEVESDTMSEAEDRNDTPTNRTHPRFSRAFSVPQLNRLTNPHRPLGPHKVNSDPGTFSAATADQLYELSLELADMVQMAIQTLLQISPPQILEPTKEQFSACTLSVPTPSMSALFTAMRNLNYFSAHMSEFGKEPSEDMTLPSMFERYTEFDLGELLQSVGDVMGGAAAEAGVDLVLYHGDLSLKYAWVSGSESGLTVSLSHVLRQIIAVAHPGDSIEVGLFIGFATTHGQDITVLPDTIDAITSSPTSEDGPIECTIQIAHKFGNGESRPNPHFSSLVLRRLLRQIGGSLKSDLPSSTSARTCELTLTLDRAPADAVSPTTSTDFAEPTTEELSLFADKLKGAKVALYASSKSSFAQHVTRYLADWGMDVSHMSGDGEVDEQPPAAPEEPPDPIIPAITSEVPTAPPSPVADLKPNRLSFIFIDDDVTVLRERLNALRVDPPYSLTLAPKRPPLPHHSRRSTNQIPRVTSLAPQPSVVIVHFTSLASFKIVKDVLQSDLSSYINSTLPMPEVMIIPKPAGPRRVLTQLHMAVTRAPVDPSFSPIATSPGTPSSSSFYGYSNFGIGRSSAGSNRPSSARSNSDRSNRSGTKDFLDRPAAPPSPLSMANGTEYFSDDAVQLGSTPSSGLLISSPPGQPAGIFFSPRASRTTGKKPVIPPMERDTGQLLPPGSRRASISRTGSDNPTFSTLHEISGRPPSRTVATPLSSSEPSSLPTLASIKTDALPTTEAPPIPQSPSPGSSSPQVNSPLRRPFRRRTATPDPKTLEKPAATPDIDIVPPISVLIVEDNVVNQMQLRGFMRKKKIKCQVANNGVEAIEKWKTGNFDLILMDIQMPVMDGIEATKEIRRLEKAKATEGYISSGDGLDAGATSSSSPYRSSVIIVAQTASSLNTDRVKALAAGCNDFLTKPVNHHWLNNKVTEWGSIKALQMWADAPPPNRQVAERLHVPDASGKQPSTPATFWGGESKPAVAEEPTSAGAPADSESHETTPDGIRP
ncbi:hypothetical protein MIND_00689600 [Mycena indigotica]|uniref:Response regulatory domain-containing protein n=1 Tax=Mycena indigotica TaxID=2126181 RepID=A0A8H6W4A9_9AGAR|nr:uncharacterized protein MIND_00689600 [Mycena indigotica]KAF7301248.1 hypothetical protein MIND_00689600 [Mycena indigotica]